MSAEPKKQPNDLKRAFREDGARKTHIGGQALIEGVMMRGKLNWAVGVREPDGNLYTEEHDLASGKEKNKWMTWPVVRGCVAFVESLVLGYKALEIAGIHAFDDEEEPEGTPSAPSSAPSSRSEVRSVADSDASAAPQAPLDVSEGTPSAPSSAPSPAAEKEPFFGEKEMAISMILGLALGIVLFIIAPAWLTNLIIGEYDQHVIGWNLTDGVLRVAVFIFYIWLIGRMKDIKRMFAYHGAEHKTIHCYEHGLPLTPENARQFPRLHVRCGTAFLIMVMIIAILIYTILPVKALIAAWGVPDGAVKLILVIIIRILFLPVIAGLSYEITVKWAGSHPDSLLVKIILWPGMQMQYLTTHEPDDSMLECAIAAMELVLAREEAAAATGEPLPEHVYAASPCDVAEKEDHCEETASPDPSQCKACIL